MVNNHMQFSEWEARQKLRMKAAHIITETQTKTDTNVLVQKQISAMPQVMAAVLRYDQAEAAREAKLIDGEVVSRSSDPPGAA